MTGVQTCALPIWGTKEELMEILHKEIGDVFMQVLEDAGVYKRTEEGTEAFGRFIETL